LEAELRTTKRAENGKNERRKSTFNVTSSHYFESQDATSQFLSYFLSISIYLPLSFSLSFSLSLLIYRALTLCLPLLSSLLLSLSLFPCTHLLYYILFLTQSLFFSSPSSLFLSLFQCFSVLVSFSLSPFHTLAVCFPFKLPSILTFQIFFFVSVILNFFLLSNCSYLFHKHSRFLSTTF